MGSCCANEREPTPLIPTPQPSSQPTGSKPDDQSQGLECNQTVGNHYLKKGKSELFPPQRNVENGRKSKRSSFTSNKSLDEVDFRRIGTIKGTEEFIGLSIKKLSRSITNYYKIKKEIHRDESFTVYLAEHMATQKDCIIKQVKKSTWKNRHTNSRNAEDLFRSEVIMVSKLDHPNISKICELFEDHLNFYIISESLTGGKLIDYLTVSKMLSEQLAANVISQVMHALLFCHSRAIVHKNLQMDSLILQSAPKDDNVHVILTGFGSSGMLTLQEKLSRRMTSVYFVAPETCYTECSEKSDIWSCGVILHMLLTGEPPFTGPNDEAVLWKIVNDNVTFPVDHWEGISTEAINLVRGMLAKEPADRISLQECLSHSWIQRFARHGRDITPKPVRNALRNLKAFQAKKQLKQAALTFMASRVGSEEESKSLTASFVAMDTNGDGLLSRSELLEAYSKIMSKEQAEFVVQRVMNCVDMDGSGFVDYSEFMLAAKNHKLLMTSSNLKLAFRAFDKDGNGRITVKEFKAAFRSRKLSVSDDMWEELLRQVDINNDGELDEGEFSRFMRMAVEL